MSGVGYSCTTFAMLNRWLFNRKKKSAAKFLPFEFTNGQGGEGGGAKGGDRSPSLILPIGPGSVYFPLSLATIHHVTVIGQRNLAVAHRRKNAETEIWRYKSTVKDNKVQKWRRLRRLRSINSEPDPYISIFPLCFVVLLFAYLPVCPASKPTGSREMS